MLRPFVVAALHAASPTGLPAFEQFARVLTWIASWSVRQGLDLDVEVVLDPDTVERFTRAELKDFPSAATYRTVLNRLGRLLTTTAPWEPRRIALTRRKVAVPFSAEEVADLLEDAERQSTACKRRAAAALIVLGAGAGIDGRWASKVRGRDVEQLEEAVVVHVGTPSPRAVPILAEYECRLLQLAEQAGDELLVGGTTPHRNRINKLVASLEIGRGHPKLALPRLRSNWIARHLQLGTRLSELLAAAGTLRIETFDELLEYVEPLDGSDARRMLRGPG